MKYFRHLSKAGQDGFMLELRDRFGAAGIGVWWTITERLAAQYEPGKRAPEERLLTATWARLCGVKVPFLIKIVSWMCDLGKIEILPDVQDGEYLFLRNWKVKVYCDRYSQNVASKLAATGQDVEGSTPQNTPKRKGKERKEKEKERIGAPAVPGGTPGPSETERRTALETLRQGREQIGTEPTTPQPGNGSGYVNLQDPEQKAIWDSVKAAGFPIGEKITLPQLQILHARISGKV